ncbi:MAG: aminotransferase class I/II-fold pyridoxal phosphate-dependent enzyme [Chloroflexi bacterium]|nr:aminotransferase class I/II-fold pyridoxal phosphate-dependent enzyme [Chloroflexota bacterium]
MSNLSSARVSQRVQSFTESVIREMTRLAQQHHAVNLAQGFPDFSAPTELKRAAAQAIHDDWNQYAITWGSPRLRHALAAKVHWFNGMEIDPETQITVTCGATEAMIATMFALVNPGDKVAILQPFYENYGPDAILAGAEPIFVSLRPPQFTFDPDELRHAFRRGARAVIINNPNNPTGRVLTYDELKTVADLCLEYDAFAITDEIYEHIVYADRPHISLATLPGMADRTVTISGLSKTYSITGWRLGYALAAPDLTNGIRKAHDFLTVGAPAPLQEAGAIALQMPRAYYDQLRADYMRRRALMLDALQNAGFTFTAPEGAYYVMTDFSAFGFDDDVAFARYLVEQIGVATVPGSSFYAPPELGKRQVRFCFCKKDETLRAASERLAQLKRK